MSESEDVYDAIGPRGGASGDEAVDGGRWHTFVDVKPPSSDRSEGPENSHTVEGRLPDSPPAVGAPEGPSAADAFDLELGELLNCISSPLEHSPPVVKRNSIVSYNSSLVKLALQRIDPQPGSCDTSEAAALYVQQLTSRSLAAIGDIDDDQGRSKSPETDDLRSSSSSEASRTGADDEDLCVATAQLEVSERPQLDEKVEIDLTDSCEGSEASVGEEEEESVDAPPPPSRPPPAPPISQFVKATFAFDPPASSSWPCGDSPPLRFQTGDIIKVLIGDQMGWSYGRVIQPVSDARDLGTAAVAGYFPTSYVDKYDDRDEVCLVDVAAKKTSDGESCQDVVEGASASTTASMRMPSAVRDAPVGSGQEAAAVDLVACRNAFLSGGKSSGPLEPVSEAAEWLEATVAGGDPDEFADTWEVLDGDEGAATVAAADDSSEPESDDEKGMAIDNLSGDDPVEASVVMLQSMAMERRGMYRQRSTDQEKDRSSALQGVLDKYAVGNKSTADEEENGSEEGSQRGAEEPIPDDLVIPMLDDVIVEDNTKVEEMWRSAEAETKRRMDADKAAEEEVRPVAAVTSSDAFEWARSNKDSIVTPEVLSEVLDGYIMPLPAHRSIVAGFTCCTTAMGFDSSAVGHPAPGIAKDLAEERDLLLCLTRAHYNPSDFEMHRRVIQTLWRKLTGSHYDCEALGEHWTVIGFQGTNPATDLNRFGGVLNLIHMLYLCDTAPMLSLAMYEASLRAGADFPFACASIKYTKLAMDIFRSGALSRRCNEEGTVMKVVAHFYAACFWLHCRLWVSHGRTIVDFDRTFKEVEKAATTAPGKLLKEFDSHKGDDTLEEEEMTRNSWNDEEEEIEFADIGAEQPAVVHRGRFGSFMKAWKIPRRLRSSPSQQPIGHLPGCCVNCGFGGFLWTAGERATSVVALGPDLYLLGATMAPYFSLMGRPPGLLAALLLSAGAALGRRLSLDTDGYLGPVQGRSSSPYVFDVRERSSGGPCDPNVRQISGYITLKEHTTRYFFMFFESRRSPETDPMIVWINGGPGFSSMAGMVLENGPCRVVNGGKETEINSHSWTSKANGIWIDQPAGTGFSTGPLISSTKRAGELLSQFLHAFFAKYPQYNRRVFLAGESYAGQFIPETVMRIRSDERAGAKPVIDIVGIAIGNGYFSSDRVWRSYPRMAYNSGTAPRRVSAAQYNSMVTAAEDCVKETSSCLTGLLSCQALYDRCSKKLIDPISDAKWSIYDLRVKCGPFADCLDDRPIRAYFNNPTVQRAIGTHIGWKSSNENVTAAFHIRELFSTSAEKQLARLLAEGIS
ncbi:ELMO CED-12 domain containing, partial [Perkinsus olseni]